MALNKLNIECNLIENVINNSKISAVKRDDILNSLAKIKSLFKSQLNQLKSNDNTSESRVIGMENHTNTDESVIECENEVNDNNREKFTKLSTDEKLDFMFEKFLEIDSKTKNFNNSNYVHTNTNKKFYNNKNNHKYTKQNINSNNFQRNQNYKQNYIQNRNSQTFSQQNTNNNRVFYNKRFNKNKLSNEYYPSYHFPIPFPIQQSMPYSYPQSIPQQNSTQYYNPHNIYYQNSDHFLGQNQNQFIQ